MSWFRSRGAVATFKRRCMPGRWTSERAVSQVALLGLILALITVVGGGSLAAVWLAELSQPTPAVPSAKATSPSERPDAGSEEPTATPAEPPATGPAEPENFADLYQNVESGVLMVRATTCDGSGSGSAFLVDGDLAVTAAHVVDEAASVAVTDGSATYQASVIGVDSATDLAILQLSDHLDGHIFAVDEAAPAAGEPLAVIGHPLGEPVTITTGAASRVDAELWPNFQLDVSISPGNSGGPVVRPDGRVVGMVVLKDMAADGLGYALGSELISGALDDPSHLTAPPPPNCDRPLGPDGPAAPEVSPVDDLHLAIAAAFDDYFTGINIGDYALAYGRLSPRLSTGMSVDEFAASVWTSYDFAFKVNSVHETSDGAAVWLEFISLQAPEYGPDGEACTYWSLDYELVWAEDGLLINGATGHDGSSGHQPCE